MAIWLPVCLHFTKENALQRFQTRHLPRRLPLPVVARLTCIVTGATSGIGLQTAKQLAEAGAHVVLACRNVFSARALVELWQKENASSLNVEILELNLLSLASVRAFAAAWLGRQCPLHILINNAGIFSMSAPLRFSEDGYEEHVQVNHLAPALLTMLLLPSLAQGFPSRIINVSSELYRFGDLDCNYISKYTPEKRKYNSLDAYCKSKLAQIYFSCILDKRVLADSGIHVFCVHPGCVLTNVTRTLPKFVQKLYRLFGAFAFSSIEGARSVIYCATNQKAYEHALRVRAEGHLACAYFTYKCQPKTVTFQSSQEIKVASDIWEKTNKAVEVSDSDMQKALHNLVNESRDYSSQHITN